MSRQTHPSKPQKILVVPLRYIGDTVVTAPLLRALKQAFPEAHIDVLVSQTTKPLLENCPYLNQLIIEPKSKRDLLKTLKANAYDMVIHLRKSVTMAALTQLAGIPTRIGYDKQRYPFGYKRWGLFLTDVIHYPSLKTDTYQAQSHLRLLHPLGIKSTDTRLELWPTEAEQQKIKTLPNLSQSSPFAVLHASSASHGKTISMSIFTPVAEQLIAQGYQVLLTGIDSDKQVYQNWLSQLPETLQSEKLAILNLAGQLSLGELVALMGQVKKCVTLDTGPLHIAAAMNVPEIIAIYGPTNEKQWGVYQPEISFKPVYKELPCRPCYAKICSHNNCRMTLTSEEILAKLN